MLNPRQAEAVAHTEGPLLILAGAGSGKTRVVTERIARLIEEGIPPHEILAVTFTNRAAEEMRHRIQQRVGTRVLACTFHSLGAKILRESITHLGYQPDFAIYDADDSEKLLKKCLTDLQLLGDKGVIKKARTDISMAKNSLLGPDQVEGDLASAYALYQSQLKMCNALDFDDLLYLTVELLKNHEEVRKSYQERWKFLLIDEYQDTNRAQHMLTQLLAGHRQNLFAVGDPDQSIYSWRGARYHNILDFQTDFPKARVIALEQNYRSTNSILQAANSLIQRNAVRYEKRLWSDLGEGAKVGLYVAVHERDEADFVARQLLAHTKRDKIPFRDIAIFYRTNAQSRAFEDALLRLRIPYRILGGLSFYQRKEIKDLLSYLHMVLSNSDLISFLRTVNLPKRGLGAAALTKLTEEAAKRGVPIFTWCEQCVESPGMSTKQREGLNEYVRLIRLLRGKAKESKIGALIAELFAQSRYLQVLQEDPETLEERKEHIAEFIGKAIEWQDENPEGTLTQFLEELSLKSATDLDNEGDAVNLMTLHNSKGLEFLLVFLGGLEEELLPHANALGNIEALSEERRLCYVGMTRAKRYLYLSHTASRHLWEGPRRMRPSRFLKELPASLVLEI